MDGTKRTAVFLSTCGGTIEDRLDLAALARGLEQQEGVKVFRAASWSEPEALQRMATEVARAGASGVVVGGASPLVSARPAWLPLAGGEPVRIQTANLREQCAWVHADAGVANEKARRLLDIALAKARAAEPLRVVQRPVNRRVAVLGAGAEAWAAARSLAASGVEVLLLPPTGGGTPARPAAAPAAAIPGVTVGRPCRVVALDGAVGDFTLTVESDRGVETLEVGAIVGALDATAQPAPAPAGLEKSAAVVRLEAFEAAPGKDAVCIRLDQTPFPGKLEARRVLAAALAQVQAGGKATVLFRNLPVFGLEGQQRYDDARAGGVRFVRVLDPVPAFEAAEGRLVATVRDAVLPDKLLSFVVDRLVLPDLLGPGAAFARLAALLRQPLDEEGLLQPSNMRHAPVAAARRGIFFCGRCHQDTDDEESELEAAALAVQVLAALPPAGTMEVAEEVVSVQAGQCASCLTCLRVCPHGAVSLKHGGFSNTPDFSDAACFECGICAAACPREAIRHGSLSREQLEAAAAVAARPLARRRPLVVFACRQGAVQAADGVGRLGLSWPDETVVVDVPCAGRVSEGVILRALSEGAGGVVVLGCHSHNCRSLHGSNAAHVRTDRVAGLLTAAGLPAARVRFESVAANESARLVRILTEAAEAIRGLPEA